MLSYLAIGVGSFSVSDEPKLRTLESLMRPMNERIVIASGMDVPVDRISDHELDQLAFEAVDRIPDLVHV